MVFTIKHIVMVSIMDTACTYGGVTPHENNKLSEPKNIGEAVYKDM